MQENGIIFAIMTYFRECFCIICTKNNREQRGRASRKGLSPTAVCPNSETFGLSTPVVRPNLWTFGDESPPTAVCPNLGTVGDGSPPCCRPS